MLVIFMFLISMAAIATKGFYYDYVMKKDITEEYTIDEFRLFGIWRD